MTSRQALPGLRSENTGPRFSQKWEEERAADPRNSSGISSPGTPGAPAPGQSKCLPTASRTCKECFSLQLSSEQCKKPRSLLVALCRRLLRVRKDDQESCVGKDCLSPDHFHVQTPFPALRWSLGLLTATFTSYWKLPCQVPTPARDTMPTLSRCSPGHAEGSCPS